MIEQDQWGRGPEAEGLWASAQDLIPLATQKIQEEEGEGDLVMEKAREEAIILTESVIRIEIKVFPERSLKKRL